MQCVTCKGDMQESKNTYMTEAQNCIVIIKNVPCMKCRECGEVIYNTEILKKVERIIRQAEQMAMEVSILDFSNAA